MFPGQAVAAVPQTRLGIARLLLKTGVYHTKAKYQMQHKYGMAVPGLQKLSELDTMAALTKVSNRIHERTKHHDSGHEGGSECLLMFRELLYHSYCYGCEAVSEVLPSQPCIRAPLPR